jgi:hypothetical protein
MAIDKAKARARKKRYLEREKISKYGPEAAGKDMRGKHGNHARGSANGRWNNGALVTSHGYVARRVNHDHPRAWGPPGSAHRYAYEHILVAMERLGRPLKGDEVIHHINGNTTDNRWENLRVLTRSEHARDHVSHPQTRDELGRFTTSKRT